MKLLHSLGRKLEQAYLVWSDRPWGQNWFSRFVNEHFSLSQNNTALQKRLIALQAMVSVRPQAYLRTLAANTPLVLLSATLSLTSGLGYRFYTSPKLDIGRASPQTIYAPASAIVEDVKTTEDQRKAARNGAIPVLMQDQAATDQIYQTLEHWLDQIENWRRTAQATRFTSAGILSTKTQLYLRKAPASEWQAITDLLKQPNPHSALPGNLSSPVKQAIVELRLYQRRSTTTRFLDLLQDITEVRLRYVAAASALPNGEGLPESDETMLFDLDTFEWQVLRTQTLRVANRILSQGIPQGLPDSLQQQAVQLQVQDAVPPKMRAFVTRLLLTNLQPNLIRDDAQTRLLADQMAQDIKPVMVKVKAGDLIVKVGEEITPDRFALLDHFGLSRRGVDWTGLLGYGVLVSGAIGVFWFVQRRYAPKLRRRDCILIWLLCLSTPLVLALRVPSTNLPAIGFLIGSFYGTPLGIAVTGLMTALLPMGVGGLPWSHLLSSAAGAILCGAVAGRLRSREELAILGGAVGLLQGTLYLILDAASGTVLLTLLSVSAIHSLIGLAWIVIGLGLSPYLEQLFDLVTPIRLVELANPNRPLLKRLAAEAPGTFQHTLFVATLAEAAARSLGCNVELVRAGTLYHDIGKMHDPLGFIENQMGGPNKHDMINNPWASATLIKKHVSEGLVMARKARLPKAVQAFIPEHQGTMLIAYFHHQAQQLQAADPDSPIVREADFRYDGPIPQSRETGIVMLADSCEAALRSLKDATYEEALAMINRILRGRWQDQQLVESGISRQEMDTIANVFVQVWQQFNHQRIIYPKQMTTASPSAASTVPS